MEFYRKVLILLIVLLTTIILFRAIQYRNQFRYVEGFYNPFAAATPKSESDAIKDIYANIPPGVVNMNKNTDLALNQFFVKASANSAYSGSMVSTDMVAVVLSRGCRFLDFQIFGAKTGNTTPMVGVQFKDGTVSQNQIALEDVFKTILINGMNTGSPNPKDPIILQLRIYPQSATGLYEAIGLAIRNQFSTGSYLFRPPGYPIQSKGPISSFMGKIIIMVDVGLAPDYKTAANYKDNGNNLANFVAIESNTTDMPSYFYDTALYNLPSTVFLNPSPNDRMTNVSTFSVVIPATNAPSQNPNYKDYVKKFGYNVVAYQYSLKDGNNLNRLEEYESVFGATTGGATPPSGFNTAFVPMSQMLTLA